MLKKKSVYLNADLKAQRRDLQIFWITIFLGYGVRTILQFLYGHYYLFIPHYYTRWNLYYISNPIMDVPNLLYVYWKHYVAFKEKPEVKNVINTGNVSIPGRSDSYDSDDSENKTVIEKFVPYEIERKVNFKLDFYDL